MKYVLPALALLVSGTLITAQEKEVPKDSQRITIPGCVDGRTFRIAAREGHDPTSGDLKPGRRFRLQGSKDILKELEKDPEYIADADKLQLERDSTSGEKVQKLIEAVALTPPAVVEHAKLLLK